MSPKRPQLGAIGTYGGRRRTPEPRAAFIVALSGLVLASAGCARPLDHVRLPGTVIARLAAMGTSAAMGTPASLRMPTALTLRQQVLAALAGYTTALNQAEASRSGAMARGLLRPYLAADRVEGLVEAMTAIWARGENFSGEDIRHVSSVKVVGRHAFVHDCDDTSGTDLVDIATGRIVPDSSGTSRANLVTRLELVSGHWLVQFQLVEDVPCVP